MAPLHIREVLQSWIGYLVRLQNAGTACRYPRCRKEVLLEVNRLCAETRAAAATTNS
jgi:hypothetical protein